MNIGRVAVGIHDGLKVLDKLVFRQRFVHHQEAPQTSEECAKRSTVERCLGYEIMLPPMEITTFLTNEVARAMIAILHGISKMLLFPVVGGRFALPGVAPC